MRQVVEAKAITKKRLGRSPDRADSVMLLLAAGSWEPVVAVSEVERLLERLRREWEAANTFEARLGRELGPGPSVGLSDDGLLEVPW